jgi:hypothetical protein
MGEIFYINALLNFIQNAVKTLEFDKFAFSVGGEIRRRGYLSPRLRTVLELFSFWQRKKAQLIHKKRPSPYL